MADETPPRSILEPQALPQELSPQSLGPQGVVLEGVALVTANEPFDVGESALIRTEFYNKDNVPTNPTTVSAMVKKPDGTYVSPAPTPTVESVGIWITEIDITAAGTWRFRISGTGTVKAVALGTFQVRENHFD